MPCPTCICPAACGLQASLPGRGGLGASVAEALEGWVGGALPLAQRAHVGMTLKRKMFVYDYVVV